MEPMLRRLAPLGLLFLLLAPVSLADEPAPPADTCFGPGNADADTRFQLLHDDGHRHRLFLGTRPDGSELLVQLVPSGHADAEPRCEVWGIGRELASVEARMVADGPENQRVTLHDSDLPGLTGVVVVRGVDDGRALAAGPFFLFCRARELRRRDLGQGFDQVSMRCVRRDARQRDEHGIDWHDAGEHLLASRQGLVIETVKSVATVPRWRDEQGRSCEATPDFGVQVVERGATPKLRALNAVDVPGWGARLLRGEPFEAQLYAYTWGWRQDNGIFFVEPPHRSERVAWEVAPACRSTGSGSPAR